MVKAKPPAYLSPKAKSIFSSVVTLFPKPSALELELLAAYAHEKAVYEESLEWINENGTVLLQRTEKGEVKAAIEAPQVKISEKARDAFIRIGRELRLDKRGE